jgi:hypothetical protein
MGKARLSGVHGGSPRIYAGEERFSAPEKSSILITRFSAGNPKPGAKAHFKIDSFFRWTKVQLPLLKQGASTRRLPQSFSEPLKADSYPYLNCTVKVVLRPLTPALKLA